MRIYLENIDGFLRLNYDSKYSGGSIPVNSVKDLIKAIEDVCGKGSYCLYEGKGEKHPKAVDYFKSKELSFPKITYFQQAVKTEVIEQCRRVAEEVWGNIPEMEIGWLENQLQSYIEDLNVIQNT